MVRVTYGAGNHDVRKVLVVCSSHVAVVPGVVAVMSTGSGRRPCARLLSGRSRRPGVHAEPSNVSSTVVRRYEGSGASVVTSSNGWWLLLIRSRRRFTIGFFSWTVSPDP